MAPLSMKQWVMRGKGVDALTFEDASVPEYGENEVLVRFHAASLNFRDLMIVDGKYMWNSKDNVVPLSDGAGEVIDVGSKVTRFQKGQRVTPTFFQNFIAGTITRADSATALGAEIDGVLREYGVFNEIALVEIPPSLSYIEAATLPCAALTAWNSLYGAKPLRPCDTVVTQGTGGVSIFAVQFAAAAGAQVISTTSSSTKAEKLKALGAHHVINYREEPNWGAAAKKLSLGGRGADYVIEIGGPSTLAQTAQAAAVEAQVAVIGQRGGKAETVINPHSVLHTTRRIMVGSRLQFEDMNRAIEINQIRPVIDEKVFAFEAARDAFRYLAEQRHVGKVVIRISDRAVGE